MGESGSLAPYSLDCYTLFLILSLLILIAAILEYIVSRKSLSNNSGVSTLLGLSRRSCGVRDILDLRVSEINVARITALTEEGEDEADCSIWKTVRRAMFDFRHTRKILALTRGILGLSNFHLLYPHIKPSFQSVADVIEPCKTPPLLLKSTDYQAVSVMVRPFTNGKSFAPARRHTKSFMPRLAITKSVQGRYWSWFASQLQQALGET